MAPPKAAALLSPPEPGFGALLSAEGCLPLRAMAVETHIVGLLYRLELRQTFVNAYPAPLEATYIFPLPPHAGVTSFELRIQDRVVLGQLRERGRARQEYAQALAEGRRAAITEEERSDVFTVRAGNIPPGEAVTVCLELSGPLAFHDGVATFRFPLVVAPRYIPGRALPGDNVGSGTALDTDAVPDASRICPPVLLPGQPNPVHLSLRVLIDPAGLSFGAPRSSLHSVVIEPGLVALRPGVERLDRDFVLELPLAGEGLQSSFLAAPDGRGETTFLLTMVPPTLERSGSLPRDVVVLLDRSGSMQGWKMAAARRAAAQLIESLTEHDRFGVLAFDDKSEVLFENLRPAGPWERAQAAEFLSAVEARGGTEIGSAVKRAGPMLQDTAEFRERALVLITDGQVGNEEQLLAQVAALREVRIYTVGIDRAVSAGLLERLASASGGRCTLVESHDRLQQAMRALHHRIGQPTLTDIALPDLGTGELTPTPCDAFPGSPAFLFGKLKKIPAGEVTVTARTPAGAPYAVRLPVQAREERVITTAWARSFILAMQDRYAAGEDLAAGITAFSLRWGVLSRFTAFVACDSVQAVDAGPPCVRATVPVEQPSGWSGALFQMQATDIQQAQTIFTQVAADAQKQRAERWRIMQDTQTRIFEITQDGTVNKARDLQRALDCVQRLLALLTGCPACQDLPADQHQHDHKLRVHLEDAGFRKAWEERVKALVDSVVGSYEWLMEAVEVLLTSIEEFEKGLDAGDRALCEAALRGILEGHERLLAARARLRQEWAFL